MKKYFEDIGEMVLGKDIFTEEEFTGRTATSVHIQNAKCKLCGEVVQYYLRTGAYSTTMGGPEQSLFDHLEKHKQ